MTKFDRLFVASSLAVATAALVLSLRTPSSQQQAFAGSLYANDLGPADALLLNTEAGKAVSQDLPEAEAFTPHVKIVGRDLAHCARHVLQKPWQADPTLCNLFETAIWQTKPRWFRS